MEGRVNFPSKGSVKGKVSLIWQRPFGVTHGAVRFSFDSITISGDSAIYFFKIMMRISLKCTLTNKNEVR